MSTQNRPTGKPLHQVLLLAGTVLALTACGQQDKKPDATGTGTGTSTATTTGTDTATTTATTTSTTTDTTGGAPTPSANGGTTGGASPTGGNSGGTGTEPTKTPEGQPTTGAKPAGPVNINLEQLPNDTPMCYVAGNTIKVGDYKRMLRIQQIQVNSSLANNPMARAQMLKLAQEKKITLTPDEKAKVLAAARQGKGDLGTFLKQNNLTEAKFDEEVINTALAFKVSNMIIEQGLLPELVNRELMAQAALEAGGEKKAMDQYFRFKHSKGFTALAEQTQLPPDSLRDEIVKAELAKQQLAKLQSGVKVAEADIKKLYDANKAQLKRNEQMLIARIVVMCPEKDIGPIHSVRTQVLNAKPELKDKPKELDAVTAQVIENQRQKALLVLGRAMGGEDFKKLANENSDDMTTKTKKNGGEMGWIEKQMLVPQMAAHLWPLKKGDVLKQLVKDDAGYTIYKCMDRRPAGTVSYAEAKPLLEAKAKQDKVNMALHGWLTKRKSVVRIEFAPKFVQLAQSLARPPQSTQ